jgi:hypothetical protein
MDNFMSMNKLINESKKNKFELLKILSEIPPREYLSQCRTEHQVINFLCLKDIFENVFFQLKNYFGGGEPVEIGDKIIKVMVDFLTRRYLDIYDLIFWSWEYQKPILGKMYGINSPIETLYEIVLGDCDLLFSQCLGYKELSGSMSVNLYYDERKIKSQNLRLKENLTVKEKRLLEKYDRKVKRIVKGNGPYQDVYYFVRAVADNYAKKDTNIRMSLENHLRNSDAIDSKLVSFLSKDKTTKVWKDGYVTKLNN